jgi:hypothetical protein
VAAAIWWGFGFRREARSGRFPVRPAPAVPARRTHESADCGTFAATSKSANQSATGTAATNQSFAAFALPFAGLRIIAGVQVVVAACDGDVGRARIEVTKPGALTLYVEWPGETKKSAPKHLGRGKS